MFQVEEEPVLDGYHIRTASQALRIETVIQKEEPGQDSDLQWEEMPHRMAQPGQRNRWTGSSGVQEGRVRDGRSVGFVTGRLWRAWGYILRRWCAGLWP